MFYREICSPALRFSELAYGISLDIGAKSTESELLSSSAHSTLSGNVNRKILYVTQNNIQACYPLCQL
jgi:hypothetical protein